MKSRNSIRVTACVFIVMALTNNTAQAERGDRQQAVQLEADKVTVDDKKKLHVYEGRVLLTQGSLQIRTSQMQVTQDNEGFQKGTAVGGDSGLASFRQKREGRQDFVDGEAERIEHDNRSERTEFFGRARVRSGLDEVTGQYILFDGKTENYSVTSGPRGTSAPAGSGQRVRAVIQPRTTPDGEAPSAKPTVGSPSSREGSKSGN
jgi:lipopolysaccharide export system protein LptA